MASTAWSLLMKLQGDSSSLQRAVASSEGSLRGLGKTTKNVGRGMSSAGRGMSVAVTAPILGLGGAAIKLASDWDTAFTGVKKTLGSDWSQDEIAKLGRDIRDMSLEVPIAATELAALGEAGGALGIRKNDMLEFIRVSALLGTTTDLSAEGAATSLGHLNTTMNLTSGEFTSLGNAVVYLGNNGASTESQILGMTESLAGTTKLLAFTKAETLGWSAALANTGEDIETGASSLSRFFMETFKMAQQGGAELELMADIAGTTGDAFKKGMEEDISGTLEALIVGMQDLTKAEQLAALEALGFTDIRITRALTKLIASGDNLTDSIDDANHGFYESGAMTEEAAKRFATFESQMLLLKAALTDIAVELGTVLLPIILEDVVPAIKDGIGVVKEWVDWFQELPEESQKSIMMWAGIAAAMGPVLFITGKITEGFGSIIGLAGRVAGLAGGLGRAAGLGGQGALSRIMAQPVFVTNWPPGSMLGGAGGKGGIPIARASLLSLGNILKGAGGTLLGIGGNALQRSATDQAGQGVGALGTIAGGALAGSAFGPIGTAIGTAAGAAVAAVTQGAIAREQISQGRTQMVEVVEDRAAGASLTELERLRADLATQLEASAGDPLRDALKFLAVNPEIERQIEAVDAQIAEVKKREDIVAGLLRDAQPQRDRAVAATHDLNASEGTRAANAMAVAQAQRDAVHALNASEGARAANLLASTNSVRTGVYSVQAAIDRMHGTLAAKRFENVIKQTQNYYNQTGSFGGATGAQVQGTQFVKHSAGAWDVPYDNYPAMLHEGELVAPKREARAIRDGELVGNAGPSGDLVLQAKVQGLIRAETPRDIVRPMRAMARSGHIRRREHYRYSD